MTDRYAMGDWTSVWAGEPFLIHRLVLDLQSRCVIAGQDRYRRRRTPMSFADLAYVQEMLDETFDDIWWSPAEYQFELRSDIPAWALEAWTWPCETREKSGCNTTNRVKSRCKSISTVAGSASLQCSSHTRESWISRLPA